MASIIIKKVRYIGDFYTYESPELRSGLNIIEGDNGTGKSTFMNLIYYGFGGNVVEFKDNSTGTHFEIRNDKNNFIELSIAINGELFVLQRFIGQNDILVLDKQGNVQIFPIFRTTDVKETFSDWILSRLGIEVVEIYQGINNWKINFTDLFRLIYHDQNPDPSDIYKDPDNQNFVTDSVFLRKVIFQLLLGKTFSDYYAKIAEFKRIEKDKNIAKAVLDQYSEMAKNMALKDDLNLVFLNQEKLELNHKLQDLYKIREGLKINRPQSHEVNTKVDILKADLLDNQIAISDLNNKKLDIVDEKIKLLRLKEDIILEVTQIKKIIYTHQELNLFSPDTCPYCLKTVSREKGHCVCGSEIDENAYEKFFYNVSEYVDILKSKQKSVDTINLAIEGCEEEIKNIEKGLGDKEINISGLKEKIKEAIGNIDSNIDIYALNDIDDKIIRVREEAVIIDEQIEFETKRDNMQKKYDTYTHSYEELKREVKQLENKANEDISEKIVEFNKKYNELMRHTLKDCRSAKIDSESYLPVINNGEYREKSAWVTIRLMYYFTLLYMSLSHDDVKYPKFLLLDNPNTSGIDLPNLQNSFNQLKNVVPQGEEEAYQVILATGVGIYPEDFKEYVFSTLSNNEKLLKPKK